MGDSFRLKEVTIEGFRGYGKEAHSIDLSQPVTLFYGKNRSGKSSTLNAIEWVLFGPEVVKKDFIDERKGWLTCNRACSSARVELVLATDGGEIRICREMGSGKKRTGGSFYFIDEEGRRSVDEGELSARLGINAKGFMNSAYLHQEVVRDILVNTPSVRKEALDRLLGVSDLRDLYNALKGVRRREYEDHVSGRYERLQEMIEMKASVYREDKKSALEDGEGLGIERGEYKTEGLVARCAAVLDILKALAGKAGIDEPRISRPETPEDFKTFPGEVGSFLNRLRSENPGSVFQGKLLREQRDLGDALARYENRAQGREKLLRERAELAGEGGIKGLEERERALSRRMEEKEAELGRANRRMPVVNATISYLEGLGQVEGKTPCPSCEQDIEPAALLERLEALTGELGGETRELAGELRRVRTERERVRGDLSRLREIEEEKLPEMAREIAGILTEIGGLLEREVGEDDDPEQLVKTRLSEIAGQLERNRKVLEEYNRGIEEVTGALEAASVVHRAVTAQSRIEVLEGITSSDEWKALNSARDGIFAELDALDKLREAVSFVLDERSAEKLRRAGDCIVDYYRTLVERPDFDAIRIDDSDHDVYAVKGGESAKVVTFFNQGDMNCVALSIFLALGGSAEREGGPSFLILDDPSQSLDSTQKRRLAGVIEKVAAGNQVLLATMDSELLEALREEVSKAKRIYRLGDWDPVKGPAIEG